MRLLLVRHGESVCSVNGIVGGEKGCTGLTERGHAQARALADRLVSEGFVCDVLLASTLPRAHETAEPIGETLGVDIVSDPELVELIPGEKDGTRWADWEIFDLLEEPDRAVSSGGESYKAMVARVCGAVDRLARAHQGRTVIAVTHGGFVFHTFRYVLDLPELHRFEAVIDNTSVSEFRFEDGARTLVRFNDVAHLMGSDLLQNA